MINLTYDSLKNSTLGKSEAFKESYRRISRFPGLPEEKRAEYPQIIIFKSSNCSIRPCPRSQNPDTQGKKKYLIPEGK